MNGPAIRERTVALPSLGFSTRLIEAGEGPPVVLLHGNPDCAEEWSGLIARLAPRFRCLAPEMPGYGGAPPLPESFGYTVPEQVRYLDDVLAAAGITGKVRLVVHDVGGMMGVPWAAANPGRLERLVVTNTVAFEGFRWFGIARRWGDDSAVGRVRGRLLMGVLGVAGGALFRRAFARLCPELPAADLERMVRRFALNPHAKAATLRQFRQVLKPDFFRGFDAMNRAISAAVPVRVLWGDGDPFVSSEHARRFGSAQVTVLPGVGHWVPIMAVEALAGAIEAP